MLAFKMIMKVAIISSSDLENPPHECISRNKAFLALGEIGDERRVTRKCAHDGAGLCALCIRMHGTLIPFHLWHVVGIPLSQSEIFAMKLAVNQGCQWDMNHMMEGSMVW